MSTGRESLLSMATNSPTGMLCTRCERPVFIPPKHGLRLPNDNPPHCHEIVHLMTGRVHSKGDPR